MAAATPDPIIQEKLAKSRLNIAMTVAICYFGDPTW
jgi:hypothetical protein